MSAERKLSIVRQPGMEPEELDVDTRFEMQVETATQIEDARALAALPASAFLRWPWDALNKQTGGMGPGTVSYVCAFSGSGKSTFITSAIDAWLALGKRVFHMPLETNPEEWRTRWACHRLGYNPGDIHAGVLQERHDWEQIQARIDAEIASQDIDLSKSEGLWVEPVGAVTGEGVERVMAKADDFDADVVIVDHIDHIGDEDGDGDFTESMRVNRAVLRLAKRYRRRVVATSQLNMEIVKADSLAKFMPPQVHHVYHKSAKIHGGIMMVGLYRPIRERRQDETEDEYVAAFKSARTGASVPSTMWKPGTMGVVNMKLRNQGQNLDGSYRHEGARCELGVENGRVVDLAPRDAHKTTW